MPKTITPHRALSAKTCKQIADLMTDYLADRMRPKVKAEFEKHLGICPDCVNFMKTYKKTVQSTATLGMEEIPANVRDNVLAFLRKQLRRVGAVVLYLMTHLAA